MVIFELFLEFALSSLLVEVLSWILRRESWRSLLDPNANCGFLIRRTDSEVRGLPWLGLGCRVTALPGSASGHSTCECSWAGSRGRE